MTAKIGRRIKEVIAQGRRKRISNKSPETAGQMIAHAGSLGVVRKALSKTQTRIGQDLGLSQNAVSQLEGRTDLLLSTLRRYLQALGADLDLVVRMKDGSRVVLDGLGQPVERTRRPKSRQAAKKPAQETRSAQPLKVD